METSAKKWVIKEFDIMDKVSNTIRFFMDKSPKDFLVKLCKDEVVHQYNVHYNIKLVFAYIRINARDRNNTIRETRTPS